MSTLSPEQRKLVVGAVSFFKKCDGSMGDVPPELKAPVFWEQQTELLESHADALAAWEKLPPRARKLVCESVETDVDSFRGDNDNLPLEIQASNAIGRIVYYLQPDILKSMVADIDERDMAHIHQSRVQSSLDEGFDLRGKILSKQKIHVGRGGSGKPGQR